MIELHYEARADELRWTPTRYRRLANAMQITDYELGAFFRLRVSEVERYLRRGFPPTVELHLTLLEKCVLPDSKPPIFPDLTC